MWLSALPRSEMNGHGERGWRERLRRVALVWAALALFVVALPACEKPAEVAKTEGEPEAALAFFVDEEDALEARAEDALRRFMLAKTDEERQRTMAELERVDEDEAWILQQSTAEELAEERGEFAAEEARRRFLLAKTYEERQRALAELKRLDPDEVDDLRDLDAEELAEEREEAALEEALLQFYIAQTEQERKRAYEEVKRLDPDEAEDLLE